MTIRSSVRLFACTALSFASSTLLTLLARSAALICLLARSLTHSRARGKVNDKMSLHQAVLNYSELVGGGRGQDKDGRRKKERGLERKKQRKTKPMMDGRDV